MQHIQAPEQAERLIDRCREIFDSEPVFTSEVGPVIGTYTGPGLIGVGAIPRTLLATQPPETGSLKSAAARRRRNMRPPINSPTTAAAAVDFGGGGARDARASRPGA